MSKYRVAFERDEAGWWMVTVPEVQGCRTQSRTIEQGLARVRGALGLFVDDARTAELVVELALPADARAAIDEAKQSQLRFEAARSAAASQSREAVRRLSKLGLSRRDVGSVLGVSGQRVQQLVGGAAKRKVVPAPRAKPRPGSSARRAAGTSRRQSLASPRASSRSTSGSR